MRHLLQHQNGYTLVELVVIILVVAVLVGIAASRMQESISEAKYEQTLSEMDQLTHAMTGNPETYAQGARSNFGFAGDNGALPPNLNALAHNPGGWATWNGPYIDSGATGAEYAQDAWGTSYILSDTLLRSTGSGSNLDKVVIGSSSMVTGNVVRGNFVDADHHLPATGSSDDVVFRLVVPNGSGGYAVRIDTLNPDGTFVLSNIPMGNHTLDVIAIPDADTVEIPVSVQPGRDVTLNVVFPADLW